MTRLVFRCAVLLITLAASFKSQAAEAQNLLNLDSVATPERIVAKVNDLPIMAREIDTIVRARTKDRNVDAQTIATMQAELLNQIIDQRLMYLFLLESKYRISDQELSAAIEQRRAKLKETENGASLEKSLQVMGITMDTLKIRLFTDLSWKKCIDDVSNSEMVAAFFQKNRTKFDGSKMRVSHIIMRPVGATDAVEVMKNMQKIRDDIVNGKITFADAAAKYSIGPSRREGGDLGVITRSGPMTEPFSRAAFDLQKGEVSPVVLTPFGMHLITVTGIKEGTATFEEVKKDVLPAFETDLFQRTIADLSKKAKIEYRADYPHIDRNTKKLVIPAATIFK